VFTYSIAFEKEINVSRIIRRTFNILSEFSLKFLYLLQKIFIYQTVIVLIQGSWNLASKGSWYILSVSKALACNLIGQEWRPFSCLVPNLHQKLLTNKQKCHPSTLLDYFPCGMWVLQLCTSIYTYMYVLSFT
jgi:hypothetical protein